MSAQGKQQLEALAAELDRKTGSQIAIVTLNTLQGEPIEDFSVKLATKWGIGRKAQGDTGVLLLLAIQDRKSRMEVGYGIEPIIPARRNHRRATHQDGRKLRRYRHRWIVERTFAWLGHFRRLVVRYERLVVTYSGLFHLACAILTLKRVLK